MKPTRCYISLFGHDIVATKGNSLLTKAAIRQHIILNQTHHILQAKPLGIVVYAHHYLSEKDEEKNRGSGLNYSLTKMALCILQTLMHRKFKNTTVIKMLWSSLNKSYF